MRMLRKIIRNFLRIISPAYRVGYDTRAILDDVLKLMDRINTEIEIIKTDIYVSKKNIESFYMEIERVKALANSIEHVTNTTRNDIKQEFVKLNSNNNSEFAKLINNHNNEFAKLISNNNNEFSKLTNIHHPNLLNQIKYNQIVLAAQIQQNSDLFSKINIDMDDQKIILKLNEIFSKKLSPIFYRTAKSVHDYDWKIKTKKFPYSCTEEEALLIYKIISHYNLTSGFEIATAFGYSATWIALALKQNGGKLVSMDCYIEESKEDSRYDYDEIIKETVRIRNDVKNGIIPIGLECAKYFINEMKLNDVVDFQIGISPEDVPSVVNKPFDFVFIDGGHFGDQPTKDFIAIKKHLAEKAIIIFHDNHIKDSPIEKAISYAENELGIQAISLNTRFNITVLAVNLDTDYIQQLIVQKDAYDIFIRNV